MKKLLIIVLAAMTVAGLLAGAAFASASSVGEISGQNIQAGTVHVDGDPDGVQIAYHTNVAGDGQFHVDGMTVSSVNAPDDYYVLVCLMSDPEWPITSGASIVAFARGQVSSGVATINQLYSGGWVTWTLNNSPKVEDINAVSILVKSTGE